MRSECRTIAAAGAEPGILDPRELGSESSLTARDHEPAVTLRRLSAGPYATLSLAPRFCFGLWKKSEVIVFIIAMLVFVGDNEISLSTTI